MYTINLINYHCYLLLILLLSAPIVLINCNQNNLETRLDCQEGESRSFKYSSETNLWGPMEELIAVSALVDIDCMGRDNKTGALKYMVQISKVKTDLKRDGKVINLGHRSEIGKIIRRREKRSEMSDWVASSWEKIKSFFTRFLRRSLEKQLEDNIELNLEGRGCRLPNSKEKESSTPRPDSSSLNRPKRSTNGNSVDHLLDEKIELPFEFIQLPQGQIPEIRLSSKETNEAVKNFKKHIVDTFATQLSTSGKSTIEKSPIGEHVSHYEYHEVSPDQPIEETLSIAGYPSLFLINRKGKEINLDDNQSQSKGNPNNGRKIQIIRAITRDDVIRVGSGSALIHDPDQVNISIRQVQEIVKGRLTETAGLISVDLTKPIESKQRRRKRDSYGNDDQLDGYMKVATAYTMNSHQNQRSKREIDERFSKLRKAEIDLDLISEPLVATSSPETENQDKLERLQGLITQIALSQQSLDFTKGSRNPDFDLLISALQIESKLKLGEKINDDPSTSSSLSAMIRLTINRAKLEANCGSIGSELNLTKCHDLMVMSILAGSPEAIQMVTESFPYDPPSVSSILSRVDHPSDELIISLIKQFLKIKATIPTSTANESAKGSMLMTISSLTYKSESVGLKKTVTKLLIKELDETTTIKCDSLYTLDILEAIGNLGGEAFVTHLINLSSDQCSSSESATIGIIHGLRQMINQPQVINFLSNLLVNSTIDCSIRKEIISTLFSSKLITINGSPKDQQQPNQQQQFRFSNPLITIPELSELSESILASNDSSDDCVKRELIRILKFEENGPTVIGSRSKRSIDKGFWDDSTCTDHLPSKPSNPPDFTMVSDHDNGNNRKARKVSTPESNFNYVQRRKCSATKAFGPKQVQAILRADIINDLLDKTENPDYKLTANFGLSSHVLGKNVDVGKMYLYAKRNMSRAYVSLFGQTLLESQRDSCETRPLEPYRYTAYVPLYDFNVWVVRLGLGLRFNGELAFDHFKSNCALKKRSSSSSELEIEDELLIKPGAQLRVAGETSGTILLLRGGIDIGGDFNYQSDLQFKPKPGFCLTARNAHQPMNVSVQPWFQFWDTSCQEWSNRHTYRPETLNWQITESRSSPWFENECIVKK